MKFTEKYFQNVAKIANLVNVKEINNLVFELKKIKNNKGRIFFLGVGGSAANCSHAVNDFRKLCNIESYTPIDNVSELTARINDEGWESSFVNWLKVSKFKKKDALFILSVGGGNKKKNVSTNLIMAIDYANSEIRSDFMDIYLGAKCFFCISTGVGLDAVPVMFRRPIAFVVVPIGIWMTSNEKFLLLTKHHINKFNKNELTISEIFSSNLGIAFNTKDYENNNV